MANVFTPLDNALVGISAVQIVFTPKGSEKGVNLGHADTIGITIEPTTVDFHNKEFGRRVLSKRIVSQIVASIEIAGLKHMSPIIRAISVLGTPDKMLQASASGLTRTFSDVEAGGIYQLPHYAIAEAGFSITDGAGTATFIEDTHYKLDREAGNVEVIALPGSGDGDMKVSYGVDAVTGGHQSGIANSIGIRGKLQLRGVNEEGIKVWVELWDVEMRPNGARSFQGEDDISSISLSGTCYPDGTKPKGYEIGRERTIA